MVPLYRSFWTLSGSPHLLDHPGLVAVSEKLHFTPAQAAFRLARSLGVTPLTGTGSETHMREDLDAVSGELNKDDDDVKAVLTLIGA